MTQQSVGTDRHPRLISAFGSERGSKFRFFEKIPNKNDLPLVCVVCLTAVRSRAISKPSSVRVRFTFHDISSATLNLNSPKRIRNGSRGKLTVKHTAQTIEWKGTLPLVCPLARCKDCCYRNDRQVRVGVNQA